MFGSSFNFNFPTLPINKLLGSSGGLSRLTNRLLEITPAALSIGAVALQSYLSMRAAPQNMSDGFKPATFFKPRSPWMGILIGAANGALHGSLLGEAVSYFMSFSSRLGNQPSPDSQSKESSLDQYCVDLTKEAKAGRLSDVIGREKEIHEVMGALLHRDMKNVMLLGAAGVGKTAIMKGLALKLLENKKDDHANNKIPPALRNKRILMLKPGALEAHTVFRGQLEGRLDDLVQELEKEENQNVILFVDEAHTLFGERTRNTREIGEKLKCIMSEGRIRLVGATTQEEYRNYIAPNKALSSRITPVMVREPGAKETEDLLDTIKGVYAKHHDVEYDDDVIKACVELTKVIPDQHFPRKAIKALDGSGSMAQMRIYRGQSLEQSSKNISKKVTVEDVNQAIESEKRSVGDLGDPPKRRYQAVNISERIRHNRYLDSLDLEISDEYLRRTGYGAGL